MTVRSLLLWAAAAAVACGNEGASGEAREAALPDTLPASVQAPEVEGGIVLVTPVQVREWQLDGADFVLIDARDSVQFAAEHLPGAINVSYVDIRPGADLPPRGSRIVVYCSDEDCPISQYAYEALQLLGFRELYDMREGLQGWKAAGYPTVIGGES